MLTVTLLVCAMMALVRADDKSTMSEVVTNTYKSGEACSGNWTLFNSRCFFYDTTPRTWAKAQQNCQAIGGNLASVHSEEEHNFLHGTSGGTGTWIGGSACQEKAIWFWSDASYFTPMFWCPSKPDGSKKEPCCLQMNTGGKKCWDDISCATELPSICSKKAE